MIKKENIIDKEFIEVMNRKLDDFVERCRLGKATEYPYIRKCIMVYIKDFILEYMQLKDNDTKQIFNDAEAITIKNISEMLDDEIAAYDKAHNETSQEKDRRVKELLRSKIHVLQEFKKKIENI